MIRMIEKKNSKTQKSLFLKFSHRNVLLTANGETAKITDFGISSNENNTANANRREHAFLSSESYMSPQMADPRIGPYTTKTDMW